VDSVDVTRWRVVALPSANGEGLIGSGIEALGPNDEAQQYEKRRHSKDSRKDEQFFPVVIFSGGIGDDRCRPRCGRNLFSAISGTLKLSDQAATSMI
jgi:hypothetical protein